MPVYVIGSTDPDDLGHIRVNLCPGYGRENATITVQSVSTVANIEILNDSDYIDFELWTEGEQNPVLRHKWSNPLVYTIDGGLKAGLHMWNDELEGFDFTYPGATFGTTRFEISCDETAGTISCLCKDPPGFSEGNRIMMAAHVHFGPQEYDVERYRFEELEHSWKLAPDLAAFENGDVMKNTELWEGEKVWEQGYQWTQGSYRVTCDAGEVVISLGEGWLIDDMFDKTKVTREHSWQLKAVDLPKIGATFTPKTGGVFDEHDILISDYFRMERERLIPGWMYTWTDESVEVKFQLIDGQILMKTNPNSSLDRVIQLFVNNTTIDNLVAHRMTGIVKCGTSWDSVPTIITNRMRQLGFGVTSELSSKRQFAFKSISEMVRITGMSYNFSVLLGFYGFGVQFPVESHPRIFFTDYKTPGLPPRPVVEFIAEGVELFLLRKEDKTPEYRKKERTFVIPCEVKVQGDNPHALPNPVYFPTPYKLNFFLDKWQCWKLEKGEYKLVKVDFKDWCTISKTNGYGKMIYQEWKLGDFNYATVVCHCQILVGDPSVVYDEKEVEIRGRTMFTNRRNMHAVPAKTTILFEEKMRIFSKDFWRPPKWTIDQKSQELIKFIQANPDGSGFDDSGTCYIQALRRTGMAYVTTTYVDENWGEEDAPKTVVTECEVWVMSDQVEYTTNYLEAPYVGYSLSTPQLYVTTNIGYQVVRNSFTTPNELSGSQVCAVLQNSFSAGMYLNGAGDFPITLNQFDLSNLEFRLVDSNYHPLKIFSPMFVIMKIEPTPDAAHDIKPFKGKLPLDAPARQAQKEQQQKQAEAEQKRQLAIDAMAKLGEQILQQQAQNQAQNQPVTTPTATPPTPPTQPVTPPQKIDINNIASVEPETLEPEAPPVPTQPVTAPTVPHA
jgi:hypothetical protein